METLQIFLIHHNVKNTSAMDDDDDDKQRYIIGWLINQSHRGEVCMTTQAVIHTI